MESKGIVDELCANICLTEKFGWRILTFCLGELLNCSFGLNLNVVCC